MDRDDVVTLEFLEQRVPFGSFNRDCKSQLKNDWWYDTDTDNLMRKSNYKWKKHSQPLYELLRELMSFSKFSLQQTLTYVKRLDIPCKEYFIEIINRHNAFG